MRARRIVSLKAERRRVFYDGYAKLPKMLAICVASCPIAELVRSGLNFLTGQDLLKS